jgi:hypothetical protein
MPRNNFAKLLLIVVLTFSAQLASAFTLTVYQVGKCRPVRKFPAYNSISAALAANPAPDAVEVCPGTYYEQIEITRPVILVGVGSGNSDQVIIAPPAGGLLTNFELGGGVRVAAQILVNDVVGLVNITGITVDGAGNGADDTTFVAGILYQGSSGIVNLVTTRNQQTPGFPQGFGIWVEGGAFSQSVTIENSFIHDFDSRGIFANFASGLALTIKGNDVKGLGATNGLDRGIDLGNLNAAVAVTDNFVALTHIGVSAGGGASGATGSISGNTFDNNVTGIYAAADGVLVTSNKIFNSTSDGIFVGSNAEQIQGNSIINTPVGIEFNCLANGNVKSNTIIDAGTALDMVPLATTSNNSYSNVGTIRTGGCP